MFSSIIVSFGHKKYLRKCINSVKYFFGEYEHEIIIINNLPSEDLSEFENTGVIIINNENKGFGQANNLGTKKSSGEYLFFLNPDSEIKSTVNRELIELLQSADCGIAGFKLIYPDGSFQLSAGREISLRNELRNKKEENICSGKNTALIKKLESEYSETKTVDWVSGAAFMCRKNVFEEAGGFNEKYFLYYEDSDLCKRITNQNYKIFYFPQVKIIHQKGKNINPAFMDETYLHAKESQLLYYSLHRNIFECFILKLYLLSKFTILYMVSFKKVYSKIIKLVFTFKQ